METSKSKYGGNLVVPRKPSIIDDPLSDDEVPVAPEPKGIAERVIQFFRSGLVEFLWSIPDRFANAVSSAKNWIMSISFGKHPSSDPLQNINAKPNHGASPNAAVHGQNERQEPLPTEYFPTKKNTGGLSGDPLAANSDLQVAKQEAARTDNASEKMLSTSASGVDTDDAEAEELRQQQKIVSLIALLDAHAGTQSAESDAKMRPKLENFLRWSAKEGINSRRPKIALLDGENVTELTDVSEKITSLLDSYDQTNMVAPEVLSGLRGSVSTLRYLLSKQTAQAELAPALKPEKISQVDPVPNRQPLENTHSTAPVRSYIAEPSRPRPDDPAALRKYAQWLYPKHADTGLQLMQRFAEFSEQSLLQKPVTASGFELHELFSVLRTLDAKLIGASDLDTSERYFLSNSCDRLRSYLAIEPERLFSLSDVNELPNGWHWPDGKLPERALSDEEIIKIRTFIKQTEVKDVRSALSKSVGLPESEGEAVLREVCAYLGSVDGKTEFNGNTNRVRKFMFRWVVQSQLGNMKQDLLPARFKHAFLPELLVVEPESSIQSEIERAFSSLAPARVGVEKIYQSSREEMIDFVTLHFERLVAEFKLSNNTSDIRRWSASLKFRLEHLDLQAVDEGEYELVARVYPNLPGDDALRDILTALSRQLINTGLEAKESMAYFTNVGRLNALLKLHSRSLPYESDE